jgi:hypothetical protein
MGRQLTIENLLRTVGILPEEVESWRHGDALHPDMNGNPDFKVPLPPPHGTHLEIHVRLKPPPQAAVSLSEDPGRAEGESNAPLTASSAQGKERASITGPAAAVQATAEGDSERGAPEIPTAKWQDLEARWKAILGLEAFMETSRISMEGLLTEMEGSLRKTLSIEEKAYALRADVAQWERAKSRAQFALPKMKDFVHRAIWAMGAPERKRLEELYKDHIQPQIPFPEMDAVLKQLEELQKDRQILAAHGKTVYQECKGISSEVQSALRTLQSNAAVNAKSKKGAAGAKGKFFKDVRRWTGP